jgi:hypothetical protein
VRWHGRFELEAKALELPETQLALAALAALPNDATTALSVLAEIAERRGIRLMPRAKAD